MALKFFHVPCRGGGSEEADLNRFLRSHRVLAVERELVLDGAAAYWALCVDFLDTGAEAAPGGARNCRAANRNRNQPGNRNNNLGFRPAAAVLRPSRSATGPPPAPL